MNNLRERIKDAGLKEKDVAKAIQKWNPKFNTACMSYIINGLLLPSAQAWAIIADKIGCQDITKVYDLKDIDIFGFEVLRGSPINKPSKSREKRTVSECYKITVRLPQYAENEFNSIIGEGKKYPTQAAFLMAALEKEKATTQWLG